MKSDCMIKNCWQSLAEKVILQAIRDATYKMWNGRPVSKPMRRDALCFISSPWCEQLATFCDAENELKKYLEGKK